MPNSDEGDTSSSSSEAGVRREATKQPAPPPSPIFPDINKNSNEVIRVKTINFSEAVSYS